MEFFSPQPDLSLQIRPPNTSTAGWRKNNEAMDLGFPRNPLDYSTTTINSNPNLNTSHHRLQFHHQLHATHDMPPLTGIPIYHHPPSSSLIGNPVVPLQLSSSSSSADHNLVGSATSQGQVRSRYSPASSRLMAKRNMRAPRMRWTLTLHGRFVHAVELLGGHESRMISNLWLLLDLTNFTNFVVEMFWNVRRLLVQGPLPSRFSSSWMWRISLWLMWNLTYRYVCMMRNFHLNHVLVDLKVSGVAAFGHSTVSFWFFLNFLFLFSPN